MSFSATTASSAAAADEDAAGETESSENPLMYWCHECDMSIHLLLPPTTTATDANNNGTNATSTAAPTCPQCHLDFLELMDPTTPSTAADFLLLDSPTFRSAFFCKQPHGDRTGDEDDDDGIPDDWSVHSYFRLLPTVRIREEANEEEEKLEEEGLLPCAVCRDQFGVEEEAKRLPCSHLFHPECILPWLSSGHHSCPLCRFQLTVLPRLALEEDNEDEQRWFPGFESRFAASSSSSSSSSSAAAAGSA